MAYGDLRGDRDLVLVPGEERHRLRRADGALASTPIPVAVEPLPVALGHALDRIEDDRGRRAAVVLPALQILDAYHNRPEDPARLDLDVHEGRGTRVVVVPGDLGAGVEGDDNQSRLAPPVDRDPDQGHGQVLGRCDGRHRRGGGSERADEARGRAGHVRGGHDAGQALDAHRGRYAAVLVAELAHEAGRQRAEPLVLKVEPGDVGPAHQTTRIRGVVLEDLGVPDRVVEADAERCASVEQELLGSDLTLGAGVVVPGPAEVARRCGSGERFHCLPWSAAQRPSPHRQTHEGVPSGEAGVAVAGDLFTEVRVHRADAELVDKHDREADLHSGVQRYRLRLALPRAGDSVQLIDRG